MRVGGISWRSQPEHLLVVIKHYLVSMFRHRLLLEDEPNLASILYHLTILHCPPDHRNPVRLDQTRLKINSVSVGLAPIVTNLGEDDGLNVGCGHGIDTERQR